MMMAQGVYALLIGALAVAEKDDSPNAAERRKRIALVADLYHPLTGLEKPSWICDAINDPGVDIDEPNSR